MTPTQTRNEDMTKMRRVLISGGSGGIGSAIARHCAAAGAWPVVGFCSRADLAQSVVQELDCGETLHLDLSRNDFGCAGQLPRVDTVVHNAALFLPGRSLLTSPEEELRRLIEVNVLGPIRLTRALLEAGNHLRDVQFILSTASFGRGAGTFALSKIGELGACKLLASDLAVRGTRVNAVAPGWTDTAVALQAARAQGCTLDDVRSKHLDGRILTADEIGELSAKLLFDPSPDNTGRLVVWDRREARDPVWLNLDAVFCADELAWTLPSAAVGSETSQS